MENLSTNANERSIGIHRNRIEEFRNFGIKMRLLFHEMHIDANFKHARNNYPI